MDKKEMKKRIINTLESGGEKNRFYVYALCDENHEPFYIGKGQGERVWAHEEGKEKETEEIEKKNVSKEEKEKMLEELSEKYKKIDEIEKNGHKVEKVIVKWGLTEPEAFMAESALINLCNYPDSTLTNVVKGHASESEKGSRSKTTKAMNEEEFLKNCGCEKRIFEKLDVDTYGKCVFICINQYYDFCIDNNGKEVRERIMDIARGCWKATRRAEHLIAVYNSRVCGVFKIEEGPKCIYDIGEKYPKYPEELRKEENNLISNVTEKGKPKEFGRLSDENKDVLEKYMKKHDTRKTKSLEEKYNNWIARRYFVCKETDKQVLRELEQCIVLKENGEAIFGSGNPIRYNY